jgi:hypothetical protein
MKQETQGIIAGHDVLAGSNQGLQPRQEPDETLTVHVIWTGDAATAAALRSASRLAAFAEGTVCLDVLYRVPFALPLHQPQVSAAWLHSHYRNFVDSAGVQASIHICLCRDEMEAVKDLFKTPAIVVVGGRKRTWLNKERRLARLLERLGHEVLFVCNEVKQ